MLYKDRAQSFNNIKEIIKSMIKNKNLINNYITDKNGEEYRVINYELEENKIVINKDMNSNEVKCNIELLYDNISKIEDRVNSVILFENID
ncbi:TPA: hypothetical protein N2D99_002159 [Clostridium botulinum]|nr:hypothetical protein [Clostridium botulinum]